MLFESRLRIPESCDTGVSKGKSMLGRMVNVVQIHNTPGRLMIAAAVSLRWNASRRSFIISRESRHHSVGDLLFITNLSSSALRWLSHERNAFSLYLPRCIELP